MEKTIVTTGKTIDLAIEAALAQLGLDRDSVSVQVLAQAKSGFLGRYITIRLLPRQDKADLTLSRTMQLLIAAKES